MWNSSEALKLMIQAAEIHAQGDIENALRLIDEAINMAKQANSLEHVVQWKQQRSLIEMGSSDDFSLFTNVMQESLDVYRQQENIAEQLNTLLNLAGIMIRQDDRSQALTYLDEADKLVANLSASDTKKLSEYLSWSSLSAETFLQIRSAEINRLRRYIAEKS